MRHLCLREVYFCAPPSRLSQICRIRPGRLEGLREKLRFNILVGSSFARPSMLTTWIAFLTICFPHQPSRLCELFSRVLLAGQLYKLTSTQSTAFQHSLAKLCVEVLSFFALVSAVNPFCGSRRKHRTHRLSPPPKSNAISTHGFQTFKRGFVQTLLSVIAYFKEFTAMVVCYGEPVDAPSILVKSERT